MKCEKAINPLLDDNDAVAFAYILTMIMDQHVKKVEHVSQKNLLCINSTQFMHPPPTSPLPYP